MAFSEQFTISRPKKNTPYDKSIPLFLDFKSGPQAYLLHKNRQTKGIEGLNKQRQSKKPTIQQQTKVHMSHKPNQPTQINQPTKKPNQEIYKRANQTNQPHPPHFKSLHKETPFKSQEVRNSTN